MPRALVDLRPMLLDDRKHRPFSDPDWLYELKYDGWRVLSTFGAGDVDVRTRNGHACTKWFPEVAVALSKLTGGPHVVDGEVCVLDDLGRSDFDRLQTRAVRRGWYEAADPVAYCVFDLLVERGASIMGLPLRERKKRLQRLFTPPVGGILVVTSIEGQGEDLYRAAVALELEGIVAKKADSLYVPGTRTTDWVKLKRPGAVPPERFRDRRGHA